MFFLVAAESKSKHLKNAWRQTPAGFQLLHGFSPLMDIAHFIVSAIFSNACRTIMLNKVSSKTHHAKCLNLTPTEIERGCHYVIQGSFFGLRSHVIVFVAEGSENQM